MNPKKDVSRVDDPRQHELKKHAQVASDVLGDLDFIDEIPPPSPRNRKQIIFPYGNNGKAMPWGSGVWK